MVGGLSERTELVAEPNLGSAPAHPQGYQSIPTPNDDAECKDESRDSQSNETKGYMGYAFAFFAMIVYKIMLLLSRDLILVHGISVRALRVLSDFLGCILTAL